jgi:hypothetical protein
MLSTCFHLEHQCLGGNWLLTKQKNPFSANKHSSVGGEGGVERKEIWRKKNRIRILLYAVKWNRMALNLTKKIVSSLARPGSML